MAIRRGQHDRVRLLLDNGADLHNKFNNDVSPYEVALDTENEEMISIVKEYAERKKVKDDT